MEQVASTMYHSCESRIKPGTVLAFKLSYTRSALVSFSMNPSPKAKTNHYPQLDQALTTIRTLYSTNPLIQTPPRTRTCRRRSTSIWGGVLCGCEWVLADLRELGAGDGGEGGDLDLVDPMKKLHEKGVKQVMRRLGREGCESSF